MLSKENIGRTYGILVGSTLAVFVTFFLRRFLHLQVIPTVLLFIILEVACYRLGVWAMIERPEELDKKFPLTVKDLRRKRRVFYDWLNSQRKN
jgi:hypothetical protein